MGGGKPVEAASPIARLPLMMPRSSLVTRDSLGTAGVPPSEEQHPPVHSPEISRSGDVRSTAVYSRHSGQVSAARRWPGFQPWLTS